MKETKLESLSSVCDILNSNYKVGDEIDFFGRRATVLRITQTAVDIRVSKSCWKEMDEEGNEKEITNPAFYERISTTSELKVYPRARKL